MKKLLAAILAIAGFGPAFAADQNPQKIATPVKAAVAVPSPFYVGLTAGAGFSNVQSDITLPGVATGTPKVWPAGFMLGATAGYLTSAGPFSLGGEVEADYDFTRASVGCSGVLPCLGTSKNGLFFAEKVLLGITLAQVTGYVPANAQPSHWPLPITVPQNFASNLMFLGEIGMAQRNVDLCAMDLATGNNLCGSQWKNGLLLGGQVRLVASQNFDVKVELNWIDFKQTFTPAQAVPLFTNTVAANNEWRFVVGFDYHLTGL